MTGKVPGTYCRWIICISGLELRKKKWVGLELESLLSPGCEVICICTEIEIYALSLFEVNIHKIDFYYQEMPKHIKMS